MCEGQVERCAHVHGGGCVAKTRPKKAAKSNRKSIDQRVRDYFVRTNIDMLIIGIFLACYHATAVYANTDEGADAGHDSTEVATAEADAHGSTEADAHGSTDAHGSSSGGHGETSESAIYAEEKREVYAILFPWFAEIIGVFVYFVLSRYAHAVPYTAIMFVIGACIGFSVQRTAENAVTFSASTWIGIEGEVILLVFLPGLLFLDSYNIDVHLFTASFNQLLTFAFPMVLAGTTLTALVAFYIFDYGWSFDLSMTFGAIMAATDPVAVAVLLNELGAPPRLKMHVSGESLMNDGSAVVFYHIFSLRYFYELGIEGIGEDVGWGEGFLLFFRLSLGGACIGVAFGVGLLMILFNLNRRLSGEDSVVQVVATVTTAYLVFFTSEILAKTSGIIAVVFCGVTVKAFGETLYNDSHLSHHFWEVTEFLLNTLLFALGGCVWGDIISSNPIVDGEPVALFSARDWGLLFALYGFLMIIRFTLVFSFYPIIARLGIGSSWQEAVFMAYGGLRGAVGIALALSLNAEMEHFTSADEVSDADEFKFREQTAKLFGMVGGIAFLTLFINAPTCGPLLKWLGLITPTETHEKVVENYRQHMIQYTLGEYVALLTEKRFEDVDFTVVKDHVPFLRETTYEQLLAAVDKHKNASPSSGYVKPNLKHVIPYLYNPGSRMSVTQGVDGDGPPYGNGSSPITKPLRRNQLMENRKESARGIKQGNGNRATVFDLTARYDEKDVQEERIMFIKILRAGYSRLVEHGELEARGFIVHSLAQSLEFVSSAASRGLPLEDWNALEVASDSWARTAESSMRKLFHLKERIKRKKYRIDLDVDYFLVKMKVKQILAFTQCHQYARRVFKEEFSKGKDGELTTAEKIVLDECDKQIELAVSTLSTFDEMDVAMVKSHYVCQILLNRAAWYFNKLMKRGLMTGKEAGEFLEEIEEYIYDISECRKTQHTDEMSAELKMKSLANIPVEMLTSLNTLGVVTEEEEEAEKA